MSIIDQAKAELTRAKVSPDETAAFVNILRTFFNMWDSGGAVSCAAPLLQRLIAGKPITPLTGADDEWIDRAKENDGTPMWQNARCTSVFKGADGVCWDIDGPGGQKVLVTFPYWPTDAAVRVPVVEVGVRPSVGGGAQ